MKKSYIFIALAMVAALTTVSCKCSSKKSQEPTQEEVQGMKQALADSVLAEIDAFADEYIDASSKSFKLRGLELTENEKLVKPDYLLDPSVANNLFTRSQKINALVIYVVERELRKIYDMPCDEIDATITKLATEVNYPFDFETQDLPLSEILKQEYEKCKENEDLAIFWQFQYSVLCEFGYILANNPELFYNNITENQWQAYVSKIKALNKAINELAKYDEEMAQLVAFRIKNKVFASSEENNTNFFQSKESAKQSRIANKDKFIAKRNALLQ